MNSSLGRGRLGSSGRFAALTRTSGRARVLYRDRGHGQAEKIGTRADRDSRKGLRRRSAPPLDGRDVQSRPAQWGSAFTSSRGGCSAQPSRWSYVPMRLGLKDPPELQPCRDGGGSIGRVTERGRPIRRPSLSFGGAIVSSLQAGLRPSPPALVCASVALLTAVRWSGRCRRRSGGARVQFGVAGSIALPSFTPLSHCSWGFWTTLSACNTETRLAIGAACRRASINGVAVRCRLTCTSSRASGGVLDDVVAAARAEHACVVHSRFVRRKCRCWPCRCRTLHRPR